MTRAMSAWLTEEDLEQLKAIAREKGIGHTTLVRMWVRERLQEYRKGEHKKCGDPRSAPKFIPLSSWKRRSRPAYTRGDCWLIFL